MTEPDWEKLKAEWRAHFRERRAVLPFAEREVVMVSTPVPWDSLSTSERNQTVAGAIGWAYEPPGYWIAPNGARYASEDLPDFVGSLDACRLVEDEIKRRSLQKGYIWALAVIVDRAIVQGADFGDWFNVLHATPDQRCRAAMQAMGVKV